MKKSGRLRDSGVNILEVEQRLVKIWFPHFLSVSLFVSLFL